MAIDMDYGNIPPDKIGEQNAMEFVSEPGRCHAVLTEFAEFGDSKHGRHIAKWEIVAHEKPSELGKVFWDYLNHPSPSHKDGGDFARNVLFAYAIALGLTTQKELAELSAKNERPNLDFANTAGRQAFLVLRAETYEGQTRIKGNAIYAIGDERAKAFPKNAGILQRAGATSAPATSPPQPAPAPAANPFAAKT